MLAVQDNNNAANSGERREIALAVLAVQDNNNAAHSGERGEIALAVLAVQDNNTRIMWERVFFLVYGVMPELKY